MLLVISWARIWDVFRKKHREFGPSPYAFAWISVESSRLEDRQRLSAIAAEEMIRPRSITMAEVCGFELLNAIHSHLRDGRWTPFPPG
jgi:hypothetical protein